MNPKCLHTLSYGLYVVSSKKGSQLNGQIANTVFQISNEPPTVAVSINKGNLTNEFISDSKVFCVSVLSKDTPLSVIGQFGFKSGRDIDKFSGVDYKTTPEGLPFLTEHVLAWLEARVIQVVDAGTHNIFIGAVTDGEVLWQGEPMTYAYYHEVKRGTTPPSAPTYVKSDAGEKTAKGISDSSHSKVETARGDTTMGKKDPGPKYECAVCGYVYDPAEGDPDNGIQPGTPFEDLPEDWVCPVCAAGKNDFRKVVE